jgi:drug/metabolite transporter (DMT)-like permease
LSGELYAIACAFFWALSSTLLKSQTSRVEVVSLAAWRMVPGVCIFLGLVAFTGQTNDVLHLSLRSLALLLGSTFLGPGLGDLSYIRSMKLIGLARAMPLSAVYPFFTLILALLFLGEELSWGMVGGALLITGGAYLLAFPRGSGRISSSAAREMDVKGVVLAVLAALCWAVDTVMLRVGLEGVHVAVANAVRLSAVAIALFAVLLRRGEVGRIGEYGLRSLGIALLAGTIGTGLGTFAFLTALQQAGAAKTSILSATTPLFGVPLSLVLGETPTSRTLLGTALTVAGVWLTV